MPSRQLQAYRDKRSQDATPEPFSGLLVPQTGKLFVVQQHQASHLHWDLRLEVDGVLRSWAIPKGPSRSLNDKRFAAEVEDHPLDYATFEGQIPEGNYGAGSVIIWDRGYYQRLNDFAEGFRKGKLLFELHGHKLRGRWTLVRMKDGDNLKNWLFIKERDAWAEDDAPYPDTSVVSGLGVQELSDTSQIARSVVRRLKRTPGAQPVKRLISCAPMLATSGESFDRAGWLFEFKYDGYRLLLEREGNRVTLRSRNGHDLSAGFPEVVDSARRLPLDSFLLDGELVRHNDRGAPDFGLLQQRAKLSDQLAVARAAIEAPCTCYVFDALQLEGFDLRSVPLEKRKQHLERLLPDYGVLRFSAHVKRYGNKLYDTARQLGLEGIVAKRADSSYRPGRSSSWIKVRQERSGDFVISGFKPNHRNPRDIGSLAIAEYRGDQLWHAGFVASGLTSELRSELRRQFSGLGDTQAPRGAGRVADCQWLDSTLVCEVRYREYTRAGHLRHPVFVRMREDKAAGDCQSQYDDPDTLAPSPAPEPDVIVTNPQKIYFPEAGYDKAAICNYYQAIAPWILPLLAGRPLVLTRFPDGIHGKSFYQRDAPDYVPDWIERRVLWSEGADREISYFIVRSAVALKYLANLGTIVIHSWHSRIDDLVHPDWCVLDLDPKTAPFSDVIELARAIGELCEELGLPAYPKTSGASGMHILIPLGRQLTHDQSRTLGELMARVLVSRYPGIATIERSLSARKNKVYLDYLQNGQGRLLVAPFSVRAEPAASVSMPISWHEVNGRLRNERFHIGNALKRMRASKSYSFADILSVDTDLPRALSRLKDIIEQTAI
jgi:bifunctional non-homologous end joining protein LigD